MKHLNDILSSEEHTYQQLMYYCFSSGKLTSLLEMYETICDVLGKKTEMILVDETYKPIRAKIQSCKIEDVFFASTFSLFRGADIFLDGLGHQSKALPVFQWTHCT